MPKIINFPAATKAFLYPEMKIMDECASELKDIILGSGNEEPFFENLKSRLDFLHVHREQSVFHREWFESIRKKKDLFALRMVRVMNIRILFAFVGTEIWFLCAFQEKDKQKQASYRKYVPVANERLDQLKKGSRNE